MKVILAIDMPESCKECRFCGFGGLYLEQYVCYLTGDHSEDSHLVGCPLRPLPEKKVPHFDPNDSTYDEKRERFIMNEINGYNRCIDEITGEAE